MNLLNRLERHLGPYAVANLTLFLIACQVVVYLAAQAKPELVEHIALIPEKVLAGEVWRLVSFLAMPPFTNVFFAFFFWYLFYLMGTALEHFWGTFRYNVFLVLGYVATVAVSFAVPDQPASNAFMQGSVFLAFAFLNPDFELYLFFILPVKIKWFALVTWIGYGLLVLFGDGLTRLLVLASVCNFLVFFAKDILVRIQTGRRRMAIQAARMAEKPKPFFHRCVVCGITDRSHPRMDFRYCSKCSGSCAYCSEHLANHDHVLDVLPTDGAGP